MSKRVNPQPRTPKTKKPKATRKRRRIDSRASHNARCIEVARMWYKWLAERAA